MQFKLSSSAFLLASATCANMIKEDHSTTKMMKSIVYGKVTVQSKLKPIPSPKRHQALIRVCAAGLNPVDAKGVVGDKLPQNWKASRWVTDYIADGHTIGFEFSGKVVECPSNIYQPGDDVYGSMPPFGGTLSEYICPPLDQIQRKPAEWSHEQAACAVLVGLTALQALQSEVGELSSILIIGASGGTGHIGVQVSKCLGATTIVGVCSAKNSAFVKSCGATYVVDYGNENFIDEIDKLGPFDVIFDCVTSADPRDLQWTYPKLLLPFCKQRYIRLGGRSIDWLKAGCERILGVTCFGKEKLFWIRFPHSSEELKQLNGWCNELRLTPTVSEVIAFTQPDVQEALDRINTRRVQGKLVVRI